MLKTTKPTITYKGSNRVYISWMSENSMPFPHKFQVNIVIRHIKRGAASIFSGTGK